MVKLLNKFSDRMLAALLPETTASAALCRGRYQGYWSGCEWFCYRSTGGDHTTQIKYCPGTANPSCKNHCYDCC